MKKRTHYKTLRIMKLALLFLLLFSSGLYASVSSQTMRVNIKVNNATTQAILDAIEKQTDYLFVYDTKEINLERKISVDANNKTVAEVLSNIFNNTEVVYAMEGSNIMLMTKSSQPNTAQQKIRKVTGTVKDKIGEPIIGANVVVKGTSNGTITDIDGQYTVEVPTSGTLQISYIGYFTQEIATGDKTKIDINLEEDTQKLDEVVIVGYGTQKKGVVTGSVSSAKGSDLIKSPTQNLGQSLQGRIAGVVINNRSGEPGADGVSINIRGKSTKGNTDPLILIDGIADRGSLDRINPNDIESITVLKDASAAIYGSRSANGVILVTTKRGKEGKPSISYNFNIGMQQPTRLPELADAATFAEVFNETEYYEGRKPKYSAEEIEKFRNGSDPVHYPNTNWVDETLKKSALQQRHNLSISGGTDRINYFVGGGYSNQDGIYKNSSTYYKQYDVRSNIDAKVTKELKVSVDLSGRMEDQHYSGIDAGTIFSSLLRAYPTSLARYPNGLPTAGMDAGNPVVMVTDETGYRKYKKAIFNGTISADWDLSWLLDGLSADGYMAYDRVGEERKEWRTPFYYYSWNEATDEYSKHMNGSRSYAELKQEYKPSTSLTLHAKVKYNKTFNTVHGVNAMVGFEQNQFNGNNFWASRSNYLSTALDELFAGSTNKKDFNNDGTAYEKARRSYFGRAAYDYAGKYMIQANFRYDGSHIFHSDKRWGFFPGVSLGWRLSEERFIKNNLEWVNNLKIRASYGKQGNDNIDPFQYLLNYTFGRNFVFGNADVQGVYQKGFPNPDVTWEVADTYNIGLDGTFWNGLLSFEVDVFKTKRSNILTKRNASIPQYTGLKDLPDENIGIVDNRGIEMLLNHVSKIGDVKLNLSGNFMFARNNVIYMDETPWGEGYDYMKAEGSPLDAGLYYHAIGIFKDQAALDAYPHLSDARPGDLIFKDVDNNGEINAMDRVREDLTNFPEIVFGLNMGADWKNFDLNILFQGQARAKQAVYSRADATGNFYMERVADRWTETNINGSQPRAGGRINFQENYGSDFFLRDASFLRLKNVELGYTLPSIWFNKFKVSNCRIYISGQNLLTFDHIKVIDPETSDGKGAYYPQMRIFNAGLSLTF